MLKSIAIENFKSIKNQKIELTKLNILIGQNGAGKSNFISLFKFLERLVNNQLSDYIFRAGGINNFLYNGYAQSDFFKIMIKLGKSTIDSNTYQFKINSNGEDFAFTNEMYGYWQENYSQPKEYLIKSNGRESGLKSIAIEKAGSYVYKYLKDLKLNHFHDTSDNASFKIAQEIDDVYYFKNEAENLAPFLFYLKENDTHTYLKIVETTSLIYPKFNDFELKESPSAKGKIVLRWLEKGNENIFNVKQMSDGTLRFICLATLLLQPKDSDKVPSTIILDEPELGLHPFAIHVLAELIQKASLERQVNIATQSITLINYFKPEDLLIAERDGEGATVFKRKTTEELGEWIEDYSLGEIWESNLIGGRP